MEYVARFNKGMRNYSDDGDTFARAAVRRILGHRVRKTHLEEVVGLLRAQFPSVAEQPPETWINVTNGLLD